VGPCAGPVLGLVLTGAVLHGANVRTSFLLLAYAAGAATSLALALLVGGRVLVVMKRSLGVSEWIRRGLGVAVLLGVVAIALGLDTGVLTRVSLTSTSKFEQDGLVVIGVHAPEFGLVRFVVTIDGAAPGKSHGIDVDEHGAGAVTDERLYQLIRQDGAVVDHTFTFG
jgi:hypothetical protein